MWVHDLPVHFVLQPDGALREKIIQSIEMGVVAKVIVGPQKCHVCIGDMRSHPRVLEE